MIRTIRRAKASGSIKARNGACNVIPCMVLLIRLIFLMYSYKCGVCVECGGKWKQ